MVGGPTTPRDPSSHPPFRVQGLRGLGVLGFRVYIRGFGVLGFRVYIRGFGVLGFRV